LITAGCATPKIQYYQLSALPAPPQSAGTGPVIEVGRIGAAQALQDGRIRYREGANAVGAYERHRWTDPPGNMARQSLIYALRASGKFGSVEESGNAAPAEYLVRGTLLEFAEVDGPEGIRTLVSIDLQLRDIKSGRAVWTRVLTRNEPVDAKKVPDVVRSLDHNLQTVITEAAGDIAAYVGAHPGASR
jgi:ABC-type uncharacterized transport system auxiliary subunit